MQTRPSIEQLGKTFFPGRTTAAARARIKKLELAELLVASWSHERGRPELTFSLTIRGRDCMPVIIQERLQIGLPHTGVIAQQLIANDVRIALQDYAARTNSQIVNWRPERELRAEYRRAVLAAERAGGSVRPREIADADVVLRDANGK